MIVIPRDCRFGTTIPAQCFDSAKRENCSPNVLANAEIARRVLIRMRRSVDDKTIAAAPD
jgi:hypothetical protein